MLHAQVDLWKVCRSKFLKLMTGSAVAVIKQRVLDTLRMSTDSERVLRGRCFRSLWLQMWFAGRSSTCGRGHGPSCTFY